MSHRGYEDHLNVGLWLWLTFCLVVVLAVGGFLGWAIYLIVGT